ncbi:MAG: ATP-binding protein, partial [Planctomycetes bacterium]|nr:ATP-binding protein [Planctomycetota bacterium]
SYVPKRRLASDLADVVARVLDAAGEDRSISRLMHRLVRTEASFVIENDLELIPSLVSHLQQAVAGIRFGDETDRLRIGVALEEALLNAYYHGNLEVSSALREQDHAAYYDLAKERAGANPWGRRRIYVDARISPDECGYTVRDDGPGFDPASLPDPTDPANIERPCGRGLLLIRTFMDEVAFNGKGNQITMIKRSPGPSAALSSRDAAMTAQKLFTVERDGAVLVVVPQHSLGSFVEAELLDHMGQVVDQIERGGIHAVVVDFQHADYFGSSMLEALRQIWNQLRRIDGRLVLCRVSEVGREIIGISHFDTVWTICDTREEALAAARA